MLRKANVYHEIHDDLSCNRRRDHPAIVVSRKELMDANIQKYQAFVETMQTGSFTRAARSLSYTQSGVSRMIADLERDWGMTLLERSRAGVTITSEGRAVLLVEKMRRLPPPGVADR